MATRVRTGRTRSYTSVSLGFVIYIVIGLIIAISQDYWNVTDWDGHELRSLLTAFLATVSSAHFHLLRDRPYPAVTAT